MAEAYEINIAPHNYYSHLADLHSLHLCAVLPNVRIMEIDIDDVPWKGELVTRPPVIKDGHIHLPTGPGWGADIDEKVLRAHPWPGPAREARGVLRDVARADGRAAEVLAARVGARRRDPCRGGAWRVGGARDERGRGRRSLR